MDRYEPIRIEVLKHLADGLLTREQAAAALDNLNALGSKVNPKTTSTSHKPGKFRGYIRVSSQMQVDSGLSLASQESQLKRLYEFLKTLPEYEGMEWGGIYRDEAQSALKVPFMMRPGGRELTKDLRPGDMIAFVRLDRVFRKTSEALKMIDLWLSLGIGVYFMDLRMDLTTANGKLFLTMLAAFAQFESDVKSERCKAAAEVRRTKKGMLNGEEWMFHKVVGKGRNRLQVPSIEKFKQARLIAKLFEMGLNFQQIADKWERRQAKREGRPYRPDGFRAGLGSLGRSLASKIYHEWIRRGGDAWEREIRADDPPKAYRKDDGTEFTVRPFCERDGSNQ